MAVADSAPPKPGWSTAFAWLCLILLLGIVVQVFLAGAGLFGRTADSPDYLAWHRSFVHAIEFLPILMLVAALVGRLGGAWIPSLALTLLIGLQYALDPYPTGHAATFAAAFHPVNALAIFGITLLLAHRFRIPMQAHRQ